VLKRLPFYKNYVDAARSRALGLTPELFGWIEMLRAAHWDCHTSGRVLNADPRAIAVMLQRDPRSVASATKKLVALGRLEIVGGAIVFADLVEQAAELSGRGKPADATTSRQISAPTSHLMSPPMSGANVPEKRTISATVRPYARASQNLELESIDSEKRVVGDDAAAIAQLSQRAQSPLWRQTERRWLADAIPKYARDDQGLRVWIASLEHRYGCDAVTAGLAAALPYVETGNVANVAAYVTQAVKKHAGRAGSGCARGFQ